ncbi:hypothetical protein NMY22_g1048 [Coprinellus aureogranulatus]|nr:hypothetical protein NMY22_g1048 [Coprinellus aureogranulatus]
MVYSQRHSAGRRCLTDWLNWQSTFERAFGQRSPRLEQHPIQTIERPAVEVAGRMAWQEDWNEVFGAHRFAWRIPHIGSLDSRKLRRDWVYCGIALSVSIEWSPKCEARLKDNEVHRRDAKDPLVVDGAPLTSLEAVQIGAGLREEAPRAARLFICIASQDAEACRTSTKLSVDLYIWPKR